MQKLRLSKALAAAGVASRRACEEIIACGRVEVNGKVALLPQTPVDPAQDRIVVDGERLRKPPKKVYYILNKPAGYLCSAVGARSILKLFGDLPYRLFTVGRLDKETTGLLLVTNDGTFAQNVIHPSAGWTKEYLAKVDQEVTPAHLQRLLAGAEVEGAFVKPVRVSKVRRGTLKIVVAEGRKREVRVLLERAGLTTRSLSRIRLGPLTLGSLAPGKWRSLTESEIKSLAHNQ